MILSGGRCVTPYAGVWIEIKLHDDLVARLGVTPYAGVWIEISRPHELVQSVTLVTPYAGVWIEISANQLFDNYV